MAISKTSVAIGSGSSAGTTTTKASPGYASAWLNCSAYYGGELGYSITNGSGAPSPAMTLLFQVSPDNGTTVFDYYAVGGDTVASSVNTGSIILDRGVMYVRVIGYGNGTNAVSLTANLQAVTAL